MHCPATPSYALQRDWAPNYLVKWLFSQEDIWVTARQEAVKVSEMDPEHALNTVLFLERVAGDLPFPREDLQSYPLYQALRGRVVDTIAPPLDLQYVAGPAGLPWVLARYPEPWAVYKLMDDGQVEWDAPMPRPDAVALAERRNREAL